MNSRLTSQLPAIVLVFSLISVLADDPRPKLRVARRDHFAGRIVVIPEATEINLMASARAIAEVGDHDLAIPPSQARASGQSLREWLRNESALEADGLIVSWEAISETGREESAAADLLRDIRRRRPRLAIHVPLGIESPQAIELWHDGVIDLLAIPRNAQLLSAESAGSNQRLARLAGLREATLLLLARIVSERFGLTPRILPVWSSTGSRDLREDVGRAISAAGGQEVAPAGSNERSPEILLFAHLPGTSDSERAAFVEGMAQAIERNARVALVDLSNDVRAGEALAGEILRRRWLDHLSSFSSSSGPHDPPSATIARSISQASLLLCSLRFLRDDPNRVFRVDRALIGLLLGSYLADYSYRRLIAPRVEEWRRETANLSEASLTGIEGRALPLLRDEAESIFNSQFRRNLHAILLRNGERMQFEIRLLQRLRLNLAVPSDADAPLEAIIRPSIHLVHTGNLAGITGQPVSWVVTNNDLDPRLVARWIEIPWSRFNAGAGAVRVTFRKADQSRGELNSDDGYRIRSRRANGTRQIEITARTAQGAHYAITGLSRLAAGGSLAADLEVSEHPVLTERGVIIDRLGPQADWSLREEIDLVTFLGRNRMNVCAIIGPEEIPEPLQRAAEAAFVKLIRLPASTAAGARPLIPVEASGTACISPVPPVTSPEPGTMRLWRLPALPYSARPRLASAADHDWNPAGYRPEIAFSSILAIEDTRATQGLQTWNLITGNCETLLPGDRLASSMTRLLVSTELIGGSRETGLLRGELMKILRNLRRPNRFPQGDHLR